MNGVTWHWSNVNQAWLILWNETLLAVKNTAAERDDYLRELGIESR